MTAPALASETVPISTLTPYPGNPHVGDVAAIAESLATLGQYRPVVVNRETREILRGNHTWQAALTLGWDQIAVCWVDVPEQAAQRIVLADNRTHQLGDTDLAALVALLTDLPDLTGTGWTAEDLLALTRTDLDDEAEGGSGTGDGLEKDQPVQVGPYTLQVQPDAWHAWADSLTSAHPARLEQLRELRRRLRMPDEEAPARPRRPKRRDITPAPAAFTLTHVEQVPVDQLTLHPGNAQQGDVGAISESLAAFGQYSPIVVRRPAPDRPATVLVGNHTLQAARALRWPTIAVTWVDVDDTTAAKILLADNRTADLGHDDPDLLLRLLLDTSDLTGTGWDGDDLDELLATANHARRDDPDGRDAPVRVGKWRTRLTPAQWQAWHELTLHRVNGTPTRVPALLAADLLLPDGSWNQ